MKETIALTIVPYVLHSHPVTHIDLQGYSSIARGIHGGTVSSRI